MAENLGAKNYQWDKKDGYWVPESRECYNSYFYPVEDSSYDIITKMYLQGKDFSGCLDGGSAYHCNEDYPLSKKQYRHLMDVAIDAGCQYFTFNSVGYQCEDCHHISKRYATECECCKSKNITYITRVIGYLKKVSNFSEVRQKEFFKRYRHKELN